MLLLYADDMALLAETPSDLQDSLDRLKQYCDQWGMEVNCAKTKVMIFKKRGSDTLSDVLSIGHTLTQTWKSFLTLTTLGMFSILLEPFPLIRTL